jgi:serine/threonine protein kinase
VITDWEMSLTFAPLFNAEGTVKVYTAPEVYQKGSAPDSQADIWSLGIIYFMLFFCIDLGYPTIFDR